MTDLLCEVQDQIALLTLNRVSKSNAFDSDLLTQIHKEIDNANTNPRVRVIILKANGAHFSAGADLSWMKKMAHFSEEENLNDALILGRLMFSLYQSPKPIIAMVQGCAFGGGAGLAAASSIAIASTTARFCFSEVKLGLIPAVISPYVVHAIGARRAQMLFMSAEVFDGAKALEFNLVQHCVPEKQLLDFTLNYARQISNNAPDSVQKSLDLIRYVSKQAIDEKLLHYTASLIAQKRVSAEGQHGLQAFLNKEQPNWNEGSHVS